MLRTVPFRLAFLGLLLTAAAAGAHDLWLEPSSFRPAQGESVAVRVRVGEHFQGDPVPRSSARIERFAAVAPGERELELPVKGAEGADPAGRATLPVPGTWILVYDTNHASVELEAETFEPYLREEGLEAIIALRAEREQSKAPAREIYSRCAKSLVVVGKESGGPAKGHDRVLGLPLELVPEASPAALPAGGELPVFLLYRGEPLAGALVVAMRKDQPMEKVSARTGKDGRVRLRLDRPGDWLVKAVHMVPAPEASGADWESFWASLTFRMGGA